MYTTLPTFAYVGEQQTNKNDEQAERNPSDNFTTTRKMPSLNSSSFDTTKYKKTNDLLINFISFTNTKIPNIDNATSVINRMLNANHRKHRARIKDHIIKSFILNLYVRQPTPHTRTPGMKKQTSQIVEHHNLPTSFNINPNTNKVPALNSIDMASKKAKKSRKEAKSRKKQKEKKAESSKQPPTPPKAPLKSCLKTPPKKSKRKKKTIRIVESDDSDDDSTDDQSDSDDDSTDEDKPKEKPHPSPRANVCYYKVKLYSNGGTNPNKIFQQLLRKWFTVMKRGVPSFLVYNYRNTSATDAIQDKTDITANLMDLKKYFIGLKLKSTPGNVWFRIRCGFDETSADMKDATDWWFRENNGVFFKQPLQVPDTVRDIWLFMSHDRIDTERLTEAVETCNIEVSISHK